MSSVDIPISVISFWLNSNASTSTEIKIIDELKSLGTDSRLPCNERSESARAVTVRCPRPEHIASIDPVVEL